MSKEKKEYFSQKEELPIHFIQRQKVEQVKWLKTINFIIFQNLSIFFVGFSFICQKYPGQGKR